MFFQSQWIALIPLNFFLHKIRPVAWPWCCQEDPSIWLESALRESLFHQNLPLGVRLMRAVGLSWGETCPSLLTRVSCWVSEVSAPSCPLPWGTVWLKLCWAWLLSESFSRHPSVVQSLPSNSQGSLEHSLLFSHSVSFPAGHKEVVLGCSLTWKPQIFRIYCHTTKSEANMAKT